MTREGSALGFVIRLLLGGALISGGLLYAAQSMQKGPASKEPVVEKIGPALSTRQAVQPARNPAPSSEPTVPALPSGQTVAGPAPALEPVPQARVSSSFSADPAPAAPAARSQTPAAPSVPADNFGVVAEDPAPQAEARQAAPGGRGQRGAQGCTQYKSYNPATQTYRSFDGKIKDCRP